MKYIGWILFFITIPTGYLIYNSLKKDYERKLKEKDREIKLWVERVKELESLESKEDTVKKVNFQLITRIQMDGMFTDYRSNEVTRKLADTLKVIARTLDTLDGDILIAVHTDDVPIGKSLRERFPSNWELSAFRAAKIAKFLIKEGISPDRLIPSGFAYSRPIKRAKDPASRKENRRIEIYIIK